MAFRSVAINYWLLCSLCALAPTCAQRGSNTTIPQAPTTAASTAAAPVLSTTPEAATVAAPTSAAPITAAPTFAAPTVGAPATVAPTIAAPTNAVYTPPSLAPTPVGSTSDDKKTSADAKNLEVILPAAIGGGLAVAGAAVGIGLGVNEWINRKDEDTATFTTTTTATLNSNGGGGGGAVGGLPKGRLVGGEAQTAFWPIIFGAIGLFFILGLAVLLIWHKCRNRRNKRITRRAQGAKQVASAEVATKSADFEVTPLLTPYSGPPSIASSSVPMTSPVYRVIQGTPMATPLTANTLMPMQAQQVVTNPALPSTSVVMGSGNQLLTTSRLPNSYLAPMG